MTLNSRQSLESSPIQLISEVFFHAGADFTDADLRGADFSLASAQKVPFFASTMNKKG